MTRKLEEHETKDPVGGISDREAVEKIDRLRSSNRAGKDRSSRLHGRRRRPRSVDDRGIHRVQQGMGSGQEGRATAHWHHRRRHQRRPGPRAHSRFLHDQRAVRSGAQQPDRGVRHRRAGPGAGGELGLHPRREDVDVQDSSGRRVPQPARPSIPRMSWTPSGIISPRIPSPRQRASSAESSPSKRTGSMASRSR